MILYHASPDQNLTFLDPGKTKSTHLKTMKKYVYASDDKSYVAGFCFEWSSRDGIRYGQHEEDGPWVIEIPKKHLYKLRKKCSIYTVANSGFRKVRGLETPEYYTKTTTKILSEEKYKTGLECLKQNNVKIEVK